MLKAMFITLFTVLLSGSASANVSTAGESVTLDMKLEMNGKPVASPRMIVELGKKGTISEQASNDPSSYSIEVEPNKRDGNLVSLNVVVSRIEGGVSKVLSTTKVSTENGHTAEITRKQSGLQGLRLLITPSF